MEIGSKIKELRILKGLTQEELADRAELSKGFISQLERDLTSPSIATLIDILQCLGTNIHEFFTEASDEQVVFKKTDYFEKSDTELQNKIEWIIPNAQKNMMEPILLALPTQTIHMKEKNLAIFYREVFFFILEIKLSRQKKGNPFILFRIKNTISLPKQELLCFGLLHLLVFKIITEGGFP